VTIVVTLNALEDSREDKL